MDDVTIVFKASKGHCDLQFGHTSKEELFARVSGFLSERMNVVQAGKSASIRIETDPVRYENCFEDEKEKVDKALDAIYELFRLSKVIAAQESIDKHGKGTAEFAADAIAVYCQEKPHD